MTAILLVLLSATGITAKVLWDECQWHKSRQDYWYEQSRFWREMWEAERTGDYGRLREVEELRRMEKRNTLGE